MAAWRRPQEADIWLTHNTQKHTNTDTGGEKGRRAGKGEERELMFFVGSSELEFLPRSYETPLASNVKTLWSALNKPTFFLLLGHGVKMAKNADDIF